MGPQLESDRVWQRAETEVGDVGKQDDGVEREEAKNPLPENFPEGFRLRMGALPELGGRFSC